MELLEFTMSHFCEKARWILDYKRVPYRVVTLVPGQHLLTTRRMGLRRSWVPVLRDGATAVQGSTQISEYIERIAPNPALLPSCSDGRALVARIDRDIGEAVRAILYDTLIREAPADVMRLWSQDGPWWAPTALRLAFPILRSRLSALYRLNREYIAAEEQRFDAMFQELEARVTRTAYVEGGTFGLADLSTAALLAPLCRPPGHHVAWPAQLPPGLHAFEARYAGSHLWRWVHEMYRLHRYPSQ
jgi:glutathione S-transferase